MTTAVNKRMGAGATRHGTVAIRLAALGCIAAVSAGRCREITDLGESVIWPLCRYTLDETRGNAVHDERGNAPAGRVHGDLAELTTAGVNAAAVRFDGSSAVEVPDSPVLDIGDGGFTLALFANRAEIAASRYDNERLVSKLPGEGDAGFGYDLALGANSVVCRLYSGQERVGQVGYQGSGLTGRWLHLAVVVERSGALMLCINGRAVARTRFDRAAGMSLGNAGPFLIGARSGSPEGWSQPFVGAIDDVRIYDRALTAEQAGILAGPLAGESLVERVRPTVDFASGLRFHELAQPRVRPRGMPPYSAVCIRTLRVDPYKIWASDVPVAEKIAATYAEGGTLWAAKAFHANKIEWVYRMNPDFAREARKMAFSIGGARSGLVAKEHPSPAELAVVKPDGELFGTWVGGYEGCAVNPAFRQYQLEFAIKVIENGADTFQHDGAGMEATRQCVCDHCVRGFRTWLAAQAPQGDIAAARIGDPADVDYRRLSEEGMVSDSLQTLWLRFKDDSIRDYHRFIRDELRRRFPTFTAYTGNNSSYQQLDTRYEPLDYFISELMFASCDPVRLFQRQDLGLAAGKAQSYHAPKAHAGESMAYMKPLSRAVIGLAYALGGWMAAPYDLFVGSDIPRHFGRPEDYADLYGFIRGNAAYLDGFERAAYAGAWLADRTAGNVLRIEGGSGGVYAVARTRPGDEDAPIVIHLVDWGREEDFLEGRFRDQTGFNQVAYKRGDTAPFVLNVRIANCYGDRPFGATLLTPPPYDADVHWAAEESGDYSALVEAGPVAFGVQGEYAQFQVPALNPYALLVLQPEVR